MSVPEIVCPLCHTRQPNAWDCAACGHPLHERPALQVSVEAIEELDTGREAAVHEVSLELVPDLEQTSADPVQVALDVVPDLDRGAAEPVGEVYTELVPELERTEIAAREAATPVASTPVCRYCGTPAAKGAGIFCAGCGMRLPIVRAATKPAWSDDGLVICGCGAPRQRVGSRCSACAGVVRQPA